MKEYNFLKLFFMALGSFLVLPGLLFAQSGGGLAGSIIGFAACSGQCVQ